LALSYDSILTQVIDQWHKNSRPGKNFTRQDIKNQLVNDTRSIIAGQNALLPKGMKMKVPDRLANVQIARIIELGEPVACISCDKDDGNSEYNLLGVYNEGIYDTSEKAIDRLISEYNQAITESDLREVKAILMRELPIRTRCMDRDLIAVNNGIFDYKNKALLPFTPDKIFLSKSAVNYNPNAQNIVINNPKDGSVWDVESWFAELSNDPEIVELLWQITGAVIRPFVRWDKCAFMYSTGGNSGKGTLCELMRNLCGKKTYASIKLNDFSKGFQLEPLIHSSAIIVDENDVGTYVDKAANLKAIITNDVVLINRKYKTPISYQFRGFMVQCLNEFPRFKDRSNSFYRRQLFIPFDKCFSGQERKYIKDDYLSRPEVLEYVLFKVLNMNYYELSEPESCKLLAEEYKEANDPLREFLRDILPVCVWDLLPFSFLFAVYKGWQKEVNPAGTPLGRNAFIHSIAELMKNDPEWDCDRHKQVVTGGKMDEPEPLILRYNLTNWYNPSYKGQDQKQICTPALKSAYRGLARKNPKIQSASSIVDLTNGPCYPGDGKVG